MVLVLMIDVKRIGLIESHMIPLKLARRNCFRLLGWPGGTYEGRLDEIADGWLLDSTNGWDESSNDDTKVTG